MLIKLVMDGPMGTLHELVTQHGKERARELVSGSAERRLIDICAEVLAEANMDAGYTYSGFCLTGLPHKRLADDQDWVRTAANGRLHMIVTPGKLYRGSSGRLYGVPYGSRARLIMLYLQSRAILKQSPEVELGRSMREWLDRMGIPPGGKSYGDVREQAARISACHLTFTWDQGNGLSGFKRDTIVTDGIAFLEHDIDTRQERLWVEKVRLSDSFYAALREHPVPVWEPALRLLSSKSQALDVYVWLAYRLHNLSTPTKISWPALHAQFGPEYKLVRQFRSRFLAVLQDALAVYPDARVDLAETGLVLHPSRPPIQGTYQHLLA